MPSFTIQSETLAGMIILCLTNHWFGIDGTSILSEMYLYKEEGEQLYVHALLSLLSYFINCLLAPNFKKKKKKSLRVLQLKL